jgi:transposase
MLEQFRERKLHKKRGQQRTDSTHVLAGIRRLNRLESVGETLRAALNALDAAAPDWLRAQVTPDWFEQYRLRKERAEQEELGTTIGVDGYL